MTPLFWEFLATGYGLNTGSSSPVWESFACEYSDPLHCNAIACVRINPLVDDNSQAGAATGGRYVSAWNVLVADRWKNTGDCRLEWS